MSRVGIVGAGTLGLTLAWRLAQAGERVVVFETARQPGGLATWFDYGDFVWDQYYHVITPGDRDLVALIEEIGLGPSLQWRPTRMGFLWRGRHLSMSSYREFLTFPALSLWSKLRLGLGLLYAARVRNVEPLEQIPASEWIPRVFGQAVWRTTWQPLLESKFGPLASRVPASLMVATIRRNVDMRSRTDGSERLGYLAGCYRSFFEHLIERIREKGGEVRLGASVEAIRAETGAAEIETPAGVERFDRVISTIPNPLFRKLASGVPGLPAETQAEPAFLGVVCLVLVLRRQLSPFYVTNLIDRDLPFTGIVEYTALADTAHLGGHHLVFLPRYEPPDSPWFQRSDADLLETAYAGLERVWPDLRSQVVSGWVHRARRVQAIWLPGTRPRTEPLASTIAPVESLTAELVGLDTLNNNAIVRLVNAHAPRILSAVRARAAAR
jgi:protoporphyrinogen oxidase